MAVVAIMTRALEGTIPRRTHVVAVVSVVGSTC